MKRRSIAEIFSNLPNDGPQAQPEVSAPKIDYQKPPAPFPTAPKSGGGRGKKGTGLYQ